MKKCSYSCILLLWFHPNVSSHPYLHFTQTTHVKTFQCLQTRTSCLTVSWLDIIANVCQICLSHKTINVTEQNNQVSTTEVLTFPLWSQSQFSQGSLSASWCHIDIYDVFWWPLDGTVESTDEFNRSESSRMMYNIFLTYLLENDCNHVLIRFHQVSFGSEWRWRFKHHYLSSRRSDLFWKKNFSEEL